MASGREGRPATTDRIGYWWSPTMHGASQRSAAQSRTEGLCKPESHGFHSLCFLLLLLLPLSFPAAFVDPTGGARGPFLSRCFFLLSHWPAGRGLRCRWAPFVLSSPSFRSLSHTTVPARAPRSPATCAPREIRRPIAPRTEEKQSPPTTCVHALHLICMTRPGPDPWVQLVLVDDSSPLLAFFFFCLLACFFFWFHPWSTTTHCSNRARWRASRRPWFNHPLLCSLLCACACPSSIWNWKPFLSSLSLSLHTSCRGRTDGCMCAGGN